MGKVKRSRSGISLVHNNKKAQISKHNPLSVPTPSIEEGEDHIEEVIVDEKDLEEENVIIWDPRDELPPDHEMVKNNLCYLSYSEYNLRESCYSMELLNDALWVDPETADSRNSQMPYHLFSLAGTQAEEESQNAIIVYRVDGIGYTQADELDSDEEDVPEEFLPEGLQITEAARTATPELAKHYEIPHPWGMINAVRAHPRMPRIVASFSSDGQVNLWDIQQFLDLMESRTVSCSTSPIKPVFTFKGHQSDGYGLSWDYFTGKLASGDNEGVVHIWEPGANMKFTVSEPIQAHNASVEDISWSVGSGAGNVFATASSDASFAIWDLRESNVNPIHREVQAHDGDVNIVQFNPHSASSYLLATGGDDGAWKVWDMRVIGKTTKNDDSRKMLALEQKWHRGPITSMKWSNYDRSMLLTSAADNLVCVWDLSVEASKDNNLEDADKKIPDMLLFYHYHPYVVDVAWHPTVNGLIQSTGQDSIHIFKPYNL